MIQDKLEVLEHILKPLRKSQRKTLTLVIEAMASMAQAASIPIAAFLSQATATQVDSALTRFYRLLHNPRLDDLLLARQILGFLSQCPSPLLVALDWTEWHPPLRMLLALVEQIAVGRVRRQSQRRRRQNREWSGYWFVPFLSQASFTLHFMICT